MRKPRPYVSYVMLKKWGRYYAILTLLVGFAAVNSGNNLLYFFLGALLSLMALSGFVSYIMLKSIMVELAPPEEVYAKSLNYLKIKIKNKGVFPIFQVYVKKSEHEKLTMEYIPAKSETQGLLPYFFEKRGPYKIEMLFVGTSFPMSFTIREMFYPFTINILVFPHIYQLEESDLPSFPKETGWGLNSNKEGSSGDFMGLKKYDRSESSSRIYWKKISLDTLYSKKFQDEDFKELILDLKSNVSEEEIEKVASEAVRLIEKGHSVGLSIDNNTVIKPDSGIKQKLLILEKLALLGYEA